MQAEELIVEVICLALKWIHLSEWLPHRMNTIINLVAETIRVVETTMECKILIRWQGASKCTWQLQSIDLDNETY